MTLLLCFNGSLNYVLLSYVSEYVMNATITPVMLHINVLLEINKKEAGLQWKVRKQVAN